MAKHSSATARSETPHVNQTSRTNTIINALKRRAQAVLNDDSIDPQTRAIIRYGLETNDPWLAELVKQVDAGESIVDTVEVLQNPGSDEIRPRPETVELDPETPLAIQVKTIEAVADIICGSGDESAGALFVLMAMFENSTQPNVLANALKHFAFTRCGELNLFGMVDAQAAILEGELLAHRPTS